MEESGLMITVIEKNVLCELLSIHSNPDDFSGSVDRHMRMEEKEMTSVTLMVAIIDSLFATKRKRCVWVSGKAFSLGEV